MRIDLHLHSPSSRDNGDSITWESTIESIKKLYNDKVKMASFTDHNTFNINLYKESREIGKTGGIVFFPGLEINVVKNNGKIAHMLIIFPETLNDGELEKIADISKKILKNGISINNINDWYSDFKTIRIIHIGKDDHFTHNDLAQLNYDAFEITNENHPNYLSVSKKGYISSIVSFSDTHHWNKYPQCKELITIIDDINEPTFENLKKCLSQNKRYYKNKYY
ncbi:MAG: hypothetical protein RRZ34_01445 [Malacoplasma sp.]